MKQSILIVLFLMFAQLLNAQINAVTESGEEVVLYENGTWKYLREDTSKDLGIKVNEKKFKKHKASTFLVKSKKMNIGIWINPKKWRFRKGMDNDACELQFQKKGDDLYAMLISEKMQIPVETLKDVAVENAKNASPDIRVTKEEYRTVNGVKVLMMQMSGSIKGVKFTYYGYYYSNTKGSMQLVVYTGNNLFEGYKKDIEIFLNGLVVQ